MDWLDFTAIETVVWIHLSGEFEWKTENGKRKVMLQCNAKAYQ